MGQKKYVITIIVSSVLAAVLLVFVVIAQLVLLPYAEHEISILNLVLSTNQDILKDTEARLDLTQSNLETKESELGRTQTELALTQDELDKTEDDLKNTEDQLASAKAEYYETSERINELEDTVGSLQAAYDETKDGYDNLMVNIDNLVNSYGYGLHDPGYDEMKSFLFKDRTNLRIDFSELETYERAYALKDNASREGIRCAVVYVTSPDTGSCCVAFNTNDKGMIYIEPSTDAEVDLQIGEKYWSSMDVIYVPPPFDDTVVNFWVMW